MAVTAQQFLQRYQNGIAGAGQRFQDGVNASEDWAARYSSADSQQRMATGLQQAINEGRPAAGAQALGTTGWRQRTVARAGNYTGSAQQAATAIQPHVQTIINAGEAARAAANAVTGPKDRTTARNKMIAAMDAIMDAWGRP